jgi:hypothetical protein
MTVQSFLPGMGALGQPTIGTQFVGPQTYLGPIPTLTLFLTPQDPSRNAAVCSAFVSIQSLATAQAKNPDAIVIPFRWLLTNTAIDTTNCAQDLSNYDYYRAATLLGGIAAITTDPKGNHVDISGPGPYLVEQFVDANGQHFLFIDFSKSKNSDFSGFSSMIAAAMQQQSELLSSNDPPNAEVLAQTGTPTAAAAAASKSNLPGWLQTICGVATSPLVKVAETILALAFPPASVVITPLESVTNTACTTPSQGNGGNASTPPAAPAPTAPAAGGKKKG